jgi:hypothetical protein
MAHAIPDSASGGSGSFQKVAAVFLASAALPFARILSAERVERVFAKHDGLFGQHGIYSTAMMVWSFLGQVLRDGKEASCQAAVARVVSYCEHERIAPPTSDTGDYCRARAKLSEAALHELSGEVAAETEAVAEADWLWKGKHAKLIDGFTFTMPDTGENQAEYPQQKSQKPGVGLPIARVVTILSLATACVVDAALGPYAGKQTGEPALLRKLMGRLDADDVAVTDRYYCSFMMIALLLAQGTHVCARKHQRRHSDFRRGRRLGKYDHTDRRREVHAGRDCRVVRLSLECGVGHPQHQVQPESRSRSLQVAGDGPPRIVDHFAGLQPDPHHCGRRGAAAWQTTTSGQLHRHVPIRAGVVDVAFPRADPRFAIALPLPNDAPSNRRLRGRQPPRPTGTQGSQATQTWLQTHATTSGNAPRRIA